jgi:hypothetical protein
MVLDGQTFAGKWLINRIDHLKLVLLLGWRLFDNAEDCIV